MKSNMLALAFVVAGGFAFLAWAQAEDKVFKATCPMSGAAAKQEHSVDYLGKKVYFCCEKCPEGFKKDPAKVAAKTYCQMCETAQLTQVACPLSGHDVDAGAAVTVNGAKILFCCEKCVAKVTAASADEKLAMVFGKPETGFTLQTTCPVSNKAIKTDVSVEHEGKKVYFCCPGCPDAFKKDPAKFADKLPQFPKK